MSILTASRSLLPPCVTRVHQVLPSCSATSAMSGHWYMHFFTTLLPHFSELNSASSSSLTTERRWKRSARIWAAFLVAGGAKGLQRPVLQRPETTSSPRHPATLTRCGVPRNAAGTRTRPRVAAQVRLHVACACVDDVLWACQRVRTVTARVVKDVGRRRLTSGRGRRLQVCLACGGGGGGACRLLHPCRPASSASGHGGKEVAPTCCGVGSYSLPAHVRAWQPQGTRWATSREGSASLRSRIRPSQRAESVHAPAGQARMRRW